MAQRDGDIEAAGFIPGARAFAKELAPSFIDHTCIVNGFAPPDGSPLGEGVGAGFAWCELHCGSAVTATLLAGCNPVGDFHAIDARGHLLEQARMLAKDGNVRNIAFHEMDVEQAHAASFPMFDYIVLNGIYSWVPLRERALILSFVRKFLKPGGAVLVTYNARPGWNRLDPFRRIFREATRGRNVDPKARFDAAREIYAKLLEAKAPALMATGVTPATIEEISRIPLEVIAADYANDFAEPLYATEVFSDFSAIDCAFAGPVEMAESATVLATHEPFKSAMESMPHVAGKELAKDLLRDTRFRRDVFVRGGRRMAADNRAMVMAGLAFVLEQPAAVTRYDVKVPYGLLRFDNEHARALVDTLEKAPRTLGDLIADAHTRGIDPQAVVGNVHALLVTGQIRPVYRATREAEQGARALRPAIAARAAKPDAIGYMPTALGTAFAVPVPDQIFLGLPRNMPADEMAKMATKQLPPMGDVIVSRARAFARNLPRYRSLGVTT
ncbi:MAG TPA: class I SAM-dependent methyltransferase [Rhizomicrobium sp.]|nr:class I SAM-dependent methyltransferase [Rhizomicrobium sp.]